MSRENAQEASSLNLPRGRCSSRVDYAALGNTGRNSAAELTDGAKRRRLSAVQSRTAARRSLELAADRGGAAGR